MLGSGHCEGGTGMKQQYLLPIIAPDGSKHPQMIKKKMQQKLSRKRGSCHPVNSVPSTPPEMLIVSKSENKQITNP